MKVEELKVEEALLKEEHRLELVLFETEVAKNKQSLNALIDKYHASKELIEQQQQQAKALIAKMMTREGTTPLVQLYYRAEESKQDLDLLKLKTNIYEDYINFLSLTEELFGTPFRNFLVE